MLHLFQSPWQMLNLCRLFLCLHSNTYMRMPNGAPVQGVAILLHHCDGARFHPFSWHVTHYFMLVWIVCASHRVHLLKSMFTKHILKSALHLFQPLWECLDLWFFCHCSHLFKKISYLHQVAAKALNPCKVHIMTVWNNRPAAYNRWLVSTPPRLGQIDGINLLQLHIFQTNLWCRQTTCNKPKSLASSTNFWVLLRTLFESAWARLHLSCDRRMSSVG